MVDPSQGSVRKCNIAGVLVDPIYYDDAVGQIIEAALGRRSFAVSALAVHGIITGVEDSNQRSRINELDLVLPDGQPVRWALNLLYRTRLSSTVRGTTVARRLLKEAEQNDLTIFLYGSTERTLRQLVVALSREFPRLQVAGALPSQFRHLSDGEAMVLAERIKQSGAGLVFVGLGCPRQERFVHYMRANIPAPLIAVGAAFDYLGGNLAEPPIVVQRVGLEWAWRLALEPRRLWRRYLLLNPMYVLLISLQAIHVWAPAIRKNPPIQVGVDG